MAKCKKKKNKRCIWKITTSKKQLVRRKRRIGNRMSL